MNMANTQLHNPTLFSQHSKFTAFNETRDSLSSNSGSELTSRWLAEFLGRGLEPADSSPSPDWLPELQSYELTATPACLDQGLRFYRLDVNGSWGCLCQTRNQVIGIASRGVAQNFILVPTLGVFEYHHRAEFLQDLKQFLRAQGSAPSMLMRFFYSQPPYKVAV